MKKGILYFLIVLLLPLAASAQNHDMDAFFNRFSSVEGATHLELSSELINLFLKRADDKNLTDAAKNISHIELLTFNSEHYADFFQTVTGSLSKTNFTELMRIRDAGEHFVVMADIDGKFVSELILVAGGNENVLIRIRGNISLDDINDFSGSTSMNLLDGFGIAH